MNYDYVFNKYIINYEKLINYGFIKKHEKYQLKKDLINDLYCIITITDKQFIINVYDESDEKYLPFYIKNKIGTFTNKIHRKVENILNDIIINCFTSTNIKDEVINYMYNKYKTIPEYPWSDNPEYCTFKTKNKWYGLIMNIKYKQLGIDNNEEIDVINIKLDPKKIESLIDNKTYFKAYHMNKKYWITILLSNNINMNQLQSLIDESYCLVNK